MTINQKTNGFTLIELIVVIVILGVLSVVAIPKFVDLQSEARISRLQALKGAIHSANNLARSAAILQGTNMNKGWASNASNTDFGETPTVKVNGKRYTMLYGYIDRLYILAFIQGTAEFGTDSSGNAYQNDTNTNANKFCSNSVHDKVCSYEWCACVFGNSYEAELIVPNGVNPKEAQTQGCYLKYSSATANEPAKVEINTDNC